MGMVDATESGDDSGEWSSVIADSSVEMVVVGEEFVEEEADVDMLPRSCNERCEDIGSMAPSAMVGGVF